MYKFSLLSIMLFLIIAGAGTRTYAQSEPVLYFCEKYDDDRGEIGVADRFTTGYLTVMVKCDRALKLEDVNIQFDKWDEDDKDFKFYKKFNYTIDRDMKYVFFTKNDESDMSFDEPGFYRVFLLDEDGETVASSLVQIIE
jgi:hypothetical protein